MSFHLLKHIRDNDEDTVIWLFNIGLEKYWNGAVFTVKNANEDVVVNHMEEMNLLLTRKQDILILRTQPDAAYLAAMEALGAEIPHIVCPSSEDETKGISELVLADDALIAHIRELIKDENKTVFVPYGVSELEEQIAERIGVTMLGSSAEINKKINNKVFSRKFAEAHGFRVSQGIVCRGYEELENAAAKALERYCKIIIKEPCGASGKGLWIVDSPAKMKSTLLIIKRFFKDKLDGEWLVEEWCDKEKDLNYQIYVGLQGEVEVFSVKEQRVNGTVYVGSVMPPAIAPQLLRECHACGEMIGRELYQMGYRGILGVDAMVLKNGELIPIIEINGRFTLSTYVSFIREKKQWEGKVFAFYHRISLKQGMDYAALQKQLSVEQSVFVYTGETVHEARIGANGRMFGLIFAADETEMMERYERVLNILSEQKE